MQPFIETSSVGAGGVSIMLMTPLAENPSRYTRSGNPRGFFSVTKVKRYKLLCFSSFDNVHNG
jgi:hypothetical protein